MTTGNAGSHSAPGGLGALNSRVEAALLLAESGAFHT